MSNTYSKDRESFSPAWCNHYPIGVWPNLVLKNHAKPTKQVHSRDSWSLISPITQPQSYWKLLFPLAENSGTQADLGGGGEMHAQVLSCLVVGTSVRC